MRPLTVLNATTATFDCSYGRGCEGICCQHGEPSVTPSEIAAIDGVMDRLRPLLRPEAAAALDGNGWLSDQRKLDLPMARMVSGWCIFFNAGCALHKLGAAEGDYTRYKPIQCVLFPLEPNGDGTWYVRQWGYHDEEWNDLFCLNPANTSRPAVEALKCELEVAATLGPTYDWGDPPAGKSMANP